MGAIRGMLIMAIAAVAIAIAVFQTHLAATRQAALVDMTQQRDSLSAQLQITKKTLDGASERLRSAAISETAKDKVLKASSGASADRWKLIAELQNKKILNAGVTKVITPDGKLSDAFSNLFELTTNEKKSLQLAVDHALEEMAELTKNNATVARDDKGNVTIKVNPFPEQGGAVYDDLMKSISQTLGAERNAAFQGLGADEMDKTLNHFGTEQRSVTFSYDPSEKNAFKVKSEIQLPDESSEMTQDYRTLSEARKGAGNLGQLLPKDFPH